MPVILAEIISTEHSQGARTGVSGVSSVRGVTLYIDLLPIIEEKDRSFGFGFVIEVRVGVRVGV